MIACIETGCSMFEGQYWDQYFGPKMSLPDMINTVLKMMHLSYSFITAFFSDSAFKPVSSAKMRLSKLFQLRKSKALARAFDGSTNHNMFLHHNQHVSSSHLQLSVSLGGFGCSYMWFCATLSKILGRLQQVHKGFCYQSSCESFFALDKEFTGRDFTLFFQLAD